MSDPRTPYQGVYQRKRPNRGALGWAVTVVGGLLIVAVVIGGLYWWNHRNDVSVAASPSRQAVQGQAISGAQGVASGVVKVTCVMPTAWTPGDTFTCYGYGSSSRELAQMRGTVLPSDGDQWQANEVWVPLG